LHNANHKNFLFNLKFNGLSIAYSVRGNKLNNKPLKYFAVCVAILFVTSAVAVFGGSPPSGTVRDAHHSTTSILTPSYLKNSALDPTLPSGFPPANFTNPQAAPPPPVPDTTPVIVSISSFGTVTIPNGTWETVILNVTGYDAGTAYDYFNSLHVDGSVVWLGVNPEAGSWGVSVNISQFMSYFDGHNSVQVTGSTLGLHQNFRGIQYNNYTLEFYPVPSGQSPPVYPSKVIQLNSGTTFASIPTDTMAAYIQSIVIDGEFQYTVNPSWEGYTWTVNGNKLAESFIYPWINSGGIDLFTWRPIYPPYMLNHQWNLVNLTDALGLIEGNNVPVQVSAASESPGIGLFAGNLFLFTNSSVIGAQQLKYNFHEGQLVNVTQTIPGLFNENGNNYSVYNSYRNIYFGGSSLIFTRQGTVKVTSNTEMNYTNLQSLPNAIWENLSQNETTVTQTSVHYNEVHMHGVVNTITATVLPVSFDYGATFAFLNSSNGLSFYNYTSYFLNVMEAYNSSVFTASHINGLISQSFIAANDMIYNTNGEFSSVLEFGPGFAIILNVTSTYHSTKKVYTYVTSTIANNVATTTVWIHKMAALGTDPALYYVQETMYLNTVTAFTFQHTVNQGHMNYFQRDN
jgi:hypothetical protein